MSKQERCPSLLPRETPSLLASPSHDSLSAADGSSQYWMQDAQNAGFRVSDFVKKGTKREVELIAVGSSNLGKKYKESARERESQKSCGGVGLADSKVIRDRRRVTEPAQPNRVSVHVVFSSSSAMPGTSDAESSVEPLPSPLPATYLDDGRILLATLDKLLERQVVVVVEIHQSKDLVHSLRVCD